MIDKAMEFDSIYMGLEFLAKEDLTFMERIDIERNELNRRIHGLRTFLCSDKFNTLDGTMQDLMKEQFEAMSKYLEVLNKRYDIILAQEK